MSKKSIWLVVAVGALAVIVTFLFLTKKSQFAAMGAAPPPPPPDVVAAAPVQEQTWETTLRATATIVAVQGVTLAAEAAGKVVDISFESGVSVKKGDLLVKLEQSNEQAQLEAAESALQLASVNFERSKGLLANSTISRSEYDASETTYRQAVAQAEGFRAIIAKKNIRAPFDGRLGIRQVNIGQILNQGDSVTTLQTLDPIYANFSLPQQRISQLAVGLPVRVSTDATPGKIFGGVLTAINSEVDPATRSIRIQATLKNSEEQLRPGMFASAAVVLPQTNKVLAVPATAILYAPFGDSVFVVEDKKDEKTGQTSKVLRQQLIRAGRAQGDYVEILEGIKPGETVVTVGVFKLRSGMPVTIDNTLAPASKLNPKPSDA